MLDKGIALIVAAVALVKAQDAAKQGSSKR
jgi:hypothetical protein